MATNIKAMVARYREWEAQAERARGHAYDEIRRLRDDEGWTMRALADESGLSLSRVEQVVNKRR